VQKLFLFFLLTAFTLSSTGAKVNIHFCGGKIKAITFFGGFKNKTCCGTKKMKKGCCKDKKVELKKADAKSHVDQFHSASSYVLQAVLPTEYPAFQTQILFAVSQQDYMTRPPPPGNRSPLYIQYSSFII